MRVLSLFTGIGAHDQGLAWAGYQIVGQCEIDEWCTARLEDRWPGIPRWKDVRDVTGESVRRACGRVDVVTGGFPCTDLSVAGKGKGLGTAEAPTERSGLFWQLLRVIREVRPLLVIIENVPAIRTRGYDRVADALAEAGYPCEPFVVGAEHVGLPHKRRRVWIVGRRDNLANVQGFDEGWLRTPRRNHPSYTGNRLPDGRNEDTSGPGELGQDVADPARHGQLGQPEGERSERERVGAGGGLMVHTESVGRGEGRAEHGVRERGNTATSGTGSADADMADPIGSGLATGRELSVRAGPQLALPARGGDAGGLADAGIERRQQDPGSALGDEAADRRAGRDVFESNGHHQPERLGQEHRCRWPARPGQPQHAWEAPRLVLPSSLLGCWQRLRSHPSTSARTAQFDGKAAASFGIPESQVGRATAGDFSRRLGRHRKHALKAMGNANPPQVVYAVGMAVRRALAYSLTTKEAA